MTLSGSFAHRLRSHPTTRPRAAAQAVTIAQHGSRRPWYRRSTPRRYATSHRTSTQGHGCPLMSHRYIHMPAKWLTATVTATPAHSAVPPCTAWPPAHKTLLRFLGRPRLCSWGQNLQTAQRMMGHQGEFDAVFNRLAEFPYPPHSSCHHPARRINKYT